MAVGIVTLYGANKAAINIEDLLGVTVKLALLTNGYTPNVGTGGHGIWSEVSAHEIGSGNGYSAGGVSLASLSKSAISGGYKFTSANAVWNATGGNIPAWRYGLLYVVGSLWGKTNPLIGHFLGDTTPADVPATPDGIPLPINCPGNGWFSVT